MRHAFSVRIGPVGFRIGSDWRAPIDQLETLYRDYPKPVDGVADFTVRLFARRPWRRLIRPSVEIGGDYMLPEAAPLPLRQGLLAAEMAMNLQMALGARRYLLLHASAVERDGRALLMTGESGAGKSTLATLLAAKGWRFMGDEFALLDPATGLVHAFPRLISLKNAGVAAAEAAWPDARMGPVMPATPKGDIRHMVPDARAIGAMDVPAIPALLLFPRYGFEPDTRPVPPAEAFIRMTQASTNYTALGEAGFRALTGLIAGVPSVAIDYPDGPHAIAQVEALWATL
ncbi:Hpr(Ser) kinase/phosphatase [Sphingomonas sp. PP-CE-3G-477]|uniref:HprK-related kinase A n=1 Tax=Sphingomonas sp. PP-CE-3G-477 TaxID=2135660 RepID=UPI000D3A5B1A|nr:HprK-related kinase A [Sphingomonas sp. PP-CE-3G-477]PTQ64210.1 Hpr(Ser) kinase/phosphatase [Sphingomonas sp. PP-CE-3G-477]